MGQAELTHPIERRLERQAPFEWGDLPRQAAWNEEFLSDLAGDPDALRTLLEAVRVDPQRRAMCEKDEFRYKIVLYDGEDRGFRLRLHAWRTGFADCVHAHRFSYTARLLNGGYQHSLWSTGDQELYPEGLEEFLEKMLPRDHRFVSQNLDLEKIAPVLITPIRAGQTYTQDNAVLSSTVTEPDTISVFLRGPAVRPHSLQWHTDTGMIVWRGGQASVPSWRQKEVAMTDDDFEQVLSKLATLAIL